MTSVTFALLVLAGSLGMLLSFIQARSRAVFVEDGFRQPARRVAAVVLLAAVLVLTVAIPFATGTAGTQAEVKQLSLVSVFAVHGILLFFLVCYFALSGRRSLADFLKLKSERPAADLSAGFLIGLAGWFVTILTAAILLRVYTVFWGRGAADTAAPTVSPLIVWLISTPLWVRIAIVVSAMIVEELFFRSFLQTRVGPVAATLMFTAAHGVYGQPLMLIGIFLISTVLSITFARYRNVLPCMVAHGVFDAIQMFIVIPFLVHEIPRL